MHKVDGDLMETPRGTNQQKQDEKHAHQAKDENEQEACPNADQKQLGAKLELENENC
jgi:hypothetical protein